MSFDVLWIPIIISGLLFMPFGAFFYSQKGMGKQWLNAINKSMEDIQREDTNMALHMLGALSMSLISTFSIAVLIASINIVGFFDLLLLIIFVYLIVFSIRLKGSIFDNNFKLFRVNLIGTLGEFAIVLAVFAFFV